MLIPSDYAHYPFLKKSANALKSIPDLQKPIVKVIETDFGKNSINLAKSRLSNALYNTKFEIRGKNTNEEIASFFFARVLISVPASTNKSLIEKFVNYETKRFYEFYKSDSVSHSNKIKDIDEDLQISSTKTKFTLKEYIPIAVKLSDSSARWKLVNMPICKGIVNIDSVAHGKFDKSLEKPEDIFFKEQIKYKIRSTLPMKLDKETRTALDPIASEIFGKYYTSMDNMDYGEVTSSNFPPCIQHVIDMIQRHDNPTHMGRFAMVSFLNEIGMSETDIAAIFQTVRDFDLSQTIYQIEHISGKQGTPAYKCPACEAMLTNGLCVGKDNSLCKKVKHPLGYYQAKHKFSLKNASEKK